MCDFCHAQLFEITHVSNIKSTFVQHSCQNAEVVEAFCRVAASRSDTHTRRSIHLAVHCCTSRACRDAHCTIFSPVCRHCASPHSCVALTIESGAGIKSS